jgi:hypothetical protein
VPVYRAQTGTDMSGVLAGDSRQSDTDTFRYYEMAGTAHSVIHKDVEVPGLGIFLEDFCQFEMNTLGDGPVFGSYLYNAMWRNMEQQVISGKEPPHGELIEVVAGEVARDEFGNGLGGIRLPQLDVPIATYGPNNSAEPSLPPFLIPIANLACRLSGTVTPLDAETLDELYPNHGSYVSQIAQRSNELAEAGFLLPKDASKLKVDAALSHIGCGIGFELAFLLPPILWLRERRRRRL